MKDLIKPKMKVREDIAAKWGNTEILEEGYVPFPKRMLRNLVKLFPDSEEITRLTVICSIVDYRRLNLSRFPSWEHLSDIAGMGVDQYRNEVKKMKKLGLLEYESSDDEVIIDISLFVREVLRFS